MNTGFELFDHTADMGIRVRAATMPELLEPAARGLYAVIGDLVPGIEASPLTLDLHGDDAAGLLRDFLAELLFLFERDGRVAESPKVRVFNERALAVIVPTRTIDPRRSEFHREVKAITYHELAIHSIAGGFEATIIVDI